MGAGHPAREGHPGVSRCRTHAARSGRAVGQCRRSPHARTRWPEHQRRQRNVLPRDVAGGRRPTHCAGTGARRAALRHPHRRTRCGRGLRAVPHFHRRHVLRARLAHGEIGLRRRPLRRRRHRVRLGAREQLPPPGEGIAVVRRLVADRRGDPEADDRARASGRPEERPVAASRRPGRGPRRVRSALEGLPEVGCRDGVVVQRRRLPPGRLRAQDRAVRCPRRLHARGGGDAAAAARLDRRRRLLSRAAVQDNRRRSLLRHPDRERSGRAAGEQPRRARRPVRARRVPRPRLVLQGADAGERVVLTGPLAHAGCGRRLGGHVAGLTRR